VWGSCGFANFGSETKVFAVGTSGAKQECARTADICRPADAEQGELCFRGRHIMMGYLANPKLGKAHVAEIEKKTAEAIDADGWLHSGDKGCLGTNGMFKITGRYSCPLTSVVEYPPVLLTTSVGSGLVWSGLVWFSSASRCESMRVPFCFAFAGCGALRPRQR
jgi:acyl-CoA synthetase (AMP-forming)/AMP-acid ligase II